MTKYPKMNDHEGVLLNPDEEYFRFACCDCGLVHTMAVVPEKDGRIGIAFLRENRATAQLRRHEFGYLQQGRGIRYEMRLKAVVKRILRDPNQSKKAKTARGKGLTSHD